MPVNEGTRPVRLLFTSPVGLGAYLRMLYIVPQFLVVPHPMRSCHLGTGQS
jgi:hypothetical protein